MKDFRSNLSEIFNRVAYGGERVSITKNNKPQAYLIDKDEMEIFEALEMANDIAAYDRAKKADNGKRYTHEEVGRELGFVK
jgi:prevent-host-death family protein